MGDLWIGQMQFGGVTNQSNSQKCILPLLLLCKPYTEWE